MRNFALTVMTLSLMACATAEAQPVQPTLQPDSCGATALQSFVGKPKSKLPVNLPKSARVMCDTCAATMDYSPTRLNVIFDTKTEIVTKVKCG